MTPLGNLVMVALVCYFAFVLYRAVSKLNSGDIGTIFTLKNEETIMGCYWLCCRNCV